MFQYTFPCGGFKTHTKMNETGIIFDPPVYEQRYCAIIQILEDQRWLHEIKKVTEFGCNDMRLFQLIRRIETIEHIIQVDIDEVTLKANLTRTNPLVSDFMRHRLRPLHVDVLHGSVGDPAEVLRNTDAVIGIELIEHVYDDVLAKIPSNVFGFMQPKLVVFSTPNSDYNTIFTRFNPLLPNGFRHLDHKFEWSREEFKSWCLSIVEKYPNYMFSLLGVGEPPAGYESVGYVSQIAIFVRKDMLGIPLAEPLTAESIPATAETYKTLHTVDFPYYVDTRTKEEKIWSEIQYELNRCTRNDDYYDPDNYMYKISISELLPRLEHLGATREILAELLRKHKKEVKNDFILIEETDDSGGSINNDPYDEEPLSSSVPQSEPECWDT